MIARIRPAFLGQTHAGEDSVKIRLERDQEMERFIEFNYMILSHTDL